MHANTPILAEEPNIPTRVEIGRAAEMADLHADGIKVDDEGPAPENAIVQPTPTGQVSEWIQQTLCPRQAKGVADMPGRCNLPAYLPRGVHQTNHHTRYKRQNKR